MDGWSSETASRFSSVEHLLQNYQAPDEALCVALAGAYGESLLRLGQALLGDPACARRMAGETIAWAVLNRSRFWSEPSLKVRLFTHALRLCRRVLLRRRLRQAGARLLSIILPSPPLSLLAEADSRDAVSALQSQVEACLSRGRRVKQLRFSLQESALFILVFITVYLMGWISGLWSTEQRVKDARVVIHTRIITQIVPPAVATRLVVIDPHATPTPPTSPAQTLPTPVPTRALPPPLKESDEITLILQRIRDHPRLWSTLWADILMVRYGPANYTGPVKAYRKQVWISQPRQSLVISGPAAGYPDALYYVVEGRVYIRHLRAGGYDASATTDAPILDIDLGNLFFNQGRLGTPRSFQLVGSEIIAGRKTLVLDSFNADGVRQRRLWVDVSRGILLRMQRFDWEGDGRLLEEIGARSIVFDVNFPPETFNPEIPWPDYFAEGYDGRADCRQELLTWVFGSDPLVNGHIVSCQRSQRNNCFAFLVGLEPRPPFYASYRLYWIPGKPDNLPIPYWIGEAASPYYALSPAGRWIIFLGCPVGPGLCFVYRYDLVNDSIKILASVAFAGYFTWSPDGEQVAMVAAKDRSQSAEVWVMLAQTGAVTRREQINWAKLLDVGLLETGSNASFPGWTGSFPPAQDALENFPHLSE